MPEQILEPVGRVGVPRWTMETDDCPCRCPPAGEPTLEFWSQTKLDDPDVDEDWTDWFPGKATATKLQKARVQLRYTGALRAPYIAKVRAITVFDGGDGAGSFDLGETVVARQITVETSGTLQFLGAGTDYIELPQPTDENAICFLAGPPGKCTPKLLGDVQRFSARKRGFVGFRRSPDENGVPIYRLMTVSGGRPACEANDVPSLTYTGNWKFRSTDNGLSGLQDPSGVDDTTLSKDLRRRYGKHAKVVPFRPPHNWRLHERPFGTYVETEDTRAISREYDCGGETKVETLTMLLGDKYETDELEAFVQARLDAQLADPDAGVSDFYLSRGIVALHRMSRGETYLERVVSQTFWTVDPPDLLDGVDLGSYAYAPDGTSISQNITYRRRELDLRTGLWSGPVMVTVPRFVTVDTYPPDAVPSYGPPGRPCHGSSGSVFTVTPADNQLVIFDQFEIEPDERLASPIVLEYLAEE